MIKFPEELCLSNYMEHTIGKERLILLEKTLRKIGNFNKKEPIVIENYEYEKEYRDVILTVTDLDNTKFIFYNYALDQDIKLTKRYNENFRFKMKRENSNTSYKYDFFNGKIEVIEIEYYLSENKSIRLHTPNYGCIGIELIENDKRYKLMMLDSSEEHKQMMLENFNLLVKKFKNIEKLNLLNALSIVEDIKKVTYCLIYKNEQKLATVSLNKGAILEYEINSDSKKVKVYIDNVITRTVERKIDINNIETKEENVDKNNPKLQTEINLLLKKL